MSIRTTVVPLGFGLSAVLCVGTGGRGEEASRTSRAPARVYTNEDLARVRPFRDELGASSVPGVAPVEQSQPSRPSGEKAVRRGEAYWRREAEKVRERVRALAEQAEALRARIAEQREQRLRLLRRGRGASAPESEATLETKLAALDRRMRALDEDLAERARRDGALPGWLR